MDYETGYCVVITVICILIIRTISSKNKIVSDKIKKPVTIKCRKGAKNMTIGSLIDLLIRFSSDMRLYVNIIDDDNYNDFHRVIDESNNSIYEWAIRQNDPLFTSSVLHEKNGIDEEKYSLTNNIITISDLVNGSKSDTDEPVEDKKDHNTLKMSPFKIKGKLLFLADSLTLLHQALVSKGSCTNDSLNIVPIEKLMKVIEQAIVQHHHDVAKFSSKHKNVPISCKSEISMLYDKKWPHIKGINRVLLSHDGECGLKSNNWDSASIIAKKLNNKSKSFPLLGNVSVNNRHHIIL